jgi:member of the syntaxin family of t-SNAREs
MLDEVDTLADRVGGKLQNGVKKVGYIIKKNEGEYPRGHFELGGTVADFRQIRCQAAASLS